MYIDMPTGDSIFSDTKKQFVYVVLSFIVSIVYLKKDWYEYWGLWMMALSFLLFCIFTFGSKTALMEGLLSIITPDLTTNIFVKLILWILALAPFILIFIALTILVYVSTAIVRKKHEGKITGNTEKDNAFRRRAFQLTDLGFFQAYELSKKKEYASFRISFDLLIGAVFSLIGFVYSSQFAELIGLPRITYADVNPLRVPAVDELNKNKRIYIIQCIWIGVTWLTSTIMGAISVRYTGEGLKLYRRMRD
jgi:hypothetical protein